MDRNVCNPFIKTVATFEELNDRRLNVFIRKKHNNRFFHEKVAQASIQ